MFENYKVYETELAGRPLKLETGMMAGLANAAVMAAYGDTRVLCTVTASAKPREGVDFFPLSVDYEEKMYSVGRIPGSFTRREGKASDKAILASRCIDRPIRPLFPKDMRNDCSVVATVMSVDPDCSPEVAAAIGVSCAIAISDIPWAGPISSVNVGLVDGEIVINPNLEQRAKTDLNLTVSSTADLVAMIEAGANEIDDDLMFDCIMAGHEENKKVVEFINGIVSEIGKPKFEFESNDPDPAIMEEIEAFCIEDVKKALDTDDKLVRDAALLPIYNAVHEKFDERFEGQEAKLDEIMYLVQKHVVRAWLKDEKKRVDGRGIDEIRPLDAKVDLLPRVHGSGMFTRGQTQVLSIATLAPVSEAQKLDGLDEEVSKRYIHHYNFPSYSVGETKPSRGPGRREIGHGALAEKALVPMIPSEKTFPYALRLVSEAIASNGSTSMGSVCASTLSLMDAGVPIKAPVAGVAMGLIKDNDDITILTDIQGLEDALGDMDFKVAGTAEGVTAIQMDMKIAGITREVFVEALEQARKGRLHILGKMLDAIAEPRAELSEYAPRIINTKVHPDKIREIIGSGGKTIKKIVEETGAKIDIEDDGSVYIASVDAKKGEAALKIIEAIVEEVEVGKIYEGTVVKIADFGAFVQIIPGVLDTSGKDGMVHISELMKGRVEKVTDLLKEGDRIVVKVLNVDHQGKVKLSRKAAIVDGIPEGMSESFHGTKAQELLSK